MFNPIQTGLLRKEGWGGEGKRGEGGIMPPT